MPTTEKAQIENPEAQWQARVRPIEVCSQTDFFDWQVETLVAKGFANYNHADPFRNRIGEFGSGLFQFTPPPPAKLNFRDTMAKVQLDGKSGVNYLDQSYHTDLIEVVSIASVLTDVDDGRLRLNVKPSVTRENIVRDKRHPFYTWRGIVYATLFPWALRGRGIDLVGSRYHSDCCPDLCVSGDGPALSFSCEGVASPHWGAASCGSVLVP